MQQFSLVVLLRLREEEVQKVASVSQLFCCYESDDKDILVTEVLKSQGKSILFILDGYDELPKTLQQKGYLLNLIKGLVLPASTVLVTSRPSATAELLTSCRPQKRVEVLGFTQESIKAYAHSIFSSDPAVLKKFMTYISISNNPAINSLMYVPLNAAIIVQIYQHSSDSSTLPHTLTELYTQLCLTVLNRNLKENLGLVVTRFEKLPARLHGHFLNLAKLAFEGIVNEEVIFHTVAPDLVHFGFLDSVSALYGGGQVSYNFLHLTIQEFLAAYHISQLRGDGLEVFEQYGGDKRWNVVWRFVAGLTKFEHFQGHVNRCLHLSFREEVYLYIQCLFEAQDFTYFRSAPAPKLFKLVLKCPSPLDMHALGCCMSNIATGIAWEVTFSGRFWDDPLHIACFTKPFMINPPSVGTIRNLKINSHEGELHLCDFKYLPLQETTVLRLISCNLTNTNLILLSELIQNMPSLEELDLSGNKFIPQHDGVLKVLQQLSHSNVTTLNVEYTGFSRLFQSNSTHDYHSALKSLINPSSGRLLELIADNCHHHDDDGILASLLSPPSSLRTLHLDSKLHFSHFEDNTRLTTLCIGFLEWSDLQLPAVVKIVKYNETLLHMKLKIYYGQGEHSHAVHFLSAVSDALQENTTLQSFVVECSHDLSQHSIHP